MATEGLLVKIGKVWMNRNCRRRRAHSPADAKRCPYCNVCRHGINEYQHCERCNTDQSWRHKPITKQEVEAVLEYLEECDPGPAYLERAPKKRFYHDGVPLILLAVKKLRQLVKSM